MCYYCKETGHIKPNRPVLKQKNQSNGSKQAKAIQAVQQSLRTIAAISANFEHALADDAPEVIQDVSESDVVGDNEEVSSCEENNT